jgi:signal peptidase II
LLDSDSKIPLAIKLKLMRLVLIIAVSVIFLDQLTKTAVRRIVVTRGTIEVIRGYFEISYVENTGVAFGLFPGQNTILAVIGFIVVGFIFAYYRRFSTNVWMKISLGLLLGGALGNLTDRIVFQHVTDFIRVRWWFLHWRWWPSFNVADAAVCVGAVMFVLGMLTIAQNVEHETQDAGNVS